MAAQNFQVVHDFGPGEALRGATVAIGNFDGVHRGHKAVIAAALARAGALGKPSAALTFEPHPRAFFDPNEPLFRLTPEDAKLRLLAAAGLDGAIVLTFNAELAKLSAQDFVQRVLVDRFAISGAAIGFNFHFGAKRAGSPEFLQAQGREHGFTVDIVPPLLDGGRNSPLHHSAAPQSPRARHRCRVGAHKPDRAADWRSEIRAHAHACRRE